MHFDCRRHHPLQFKNPHLAGFSSVRQFIWAALFAYCVPVVPVVPVAEVTTPAQSNVPRAIAGALSPPKAASIARCAPTSTEPSDGIGWSASAKALPQTRQARTKTGIFM
jgi:hypothetical protein